MTYPDNENSLVGICLRKVEDAHRHAVLVGFFSCTAGGVYGTRQAKSSRERLYSCHRAETTSRLGVIGASDDDSDIKGIEQLCVS